MLSRCGFNQLKLSRLSGSHQVSVAMLYYGIVMVSIGSLSTGSPSVSFFSSGFVMVSIGSLSTLQVSVASAIGSHSVISFSSGECGNTNYSIVIVSIGVGSAS